MTRRPRRSTLILTLCPYTTRFRSHEEVAVWARDLPSAPRIVVYCVHGHEVSQNACKNLRELGYGATFLEGGIDAWKQADLPLAKNSE